MSPLAELLGESPGIQAVRETVGRLLARGAEGRRLPTILIQGETGTGKGLLARVLHRAGPRATGPLVELNCAAIPETLLEAELFGFERGAFTDARQPKAGLFQTAHGGTLFLDEVGLLPERVQAKFLKVLEDGAVRRLGSTQSEPADVVIVAATSEDLLDAAVRARRFREDLYHRLAVVTVRLPPLAERGSDILLLAEHFLARACADYRVGPKTLAPDARAALLAYRWPGNIRELANVMERAALLTDTPMVTADALGLPVTSGLAGTAAEEAAPVSPLRDAMGTVEREHLLAALRETDWNIAGAAARLGIPRGTLRYRIEKLGLQRSGSPPTRAGPSVTRAMPESASPLPAGPVRAAPSWERRWLAFLRVVLIPPPDRDGGAEIARALEVLVEKVESFGGRIEAMGPRGVIATFGLEAVEDAPRRAAHAAIAIRKAAERARPATATRVSTKMAIHVSQGLVGQAGDAPVIDVAATGDAHAVLEPLVAAAEPDSILVTAAAARTLDRRFELVPVSPDDTTREPVYRLAGLERPGLALRGHMTPLVGRGSELEQLRHVLGRATAGHGQLVAIVGDPGVGKSRLVWEVMQASCPQGWRIEHASAVSYGQATPFQPVIALLRAYFHIEDRDDPPAIREKVRAQLAALDPTLESNLPALLALLDVSPEDSPWQALDPSQRRQRTLDAVKRLWLRQAQIQPLLLVVEDLHWIDAETQALLDSLVESLRTAPLCLLVDYRPEYQHAWSSTTAYTQLRLDPLAPESAQELLRTLLGGDPGLERLTALLLERTEGNPFFLEETVQALAETKALAGQRGAYALARPIDTIEVPGTVEAVLAARIDRLGPEAKRLLQAAAVIGKDVALPLLLAIADAPEPEVRAELTHLQAAELLYETRLVSDLEYTFKHALTHEVAYQGLVQDRRRALHARITEALERLAPERVAEQAERLAHHALRGELWDEAVTYLRQAGLRAMARGANREAIAHLEQALGALRRLPETRESTELTIDIYLDLRNALEPLDWARRGEPLHEAEGLAGALGDPHRLARIATFMVDQYLSTGDYNAAVRFGQEALSLARTLGDRATEVVATTFLALTQNFRGEFSDAAALFERNVVALEGDLRNERFGTAWVHSAFSEANLAEAFSQLGRFDEAIEHGEVAVRISETADHPLTLSLGLFSLGLAHLRRGDLPRATPVLERCVDVARTWQFVIYAPLHAAALGAAYVLAGRAEEGLPLVAGAVEEFHGRRYDTKPALIPLYAGMAYLSAGRIDKAKSHAREALALSRWLGARGSEAHALCLVGDVGSACSAEDAEGYYREALALATGLGMRPLVAHCHLGLGRLWRRTGDRAKGDDSLAAAITMYREMGMTFWLEKAEPGEFS